jgi:hypothetical protein
MLMLQILGLVTASVVEIIWLLLAMMSEGSVRVREN